MLPPCWLSWLCVGSARVEFWFLWVPVLCKLGSSLVQCWIGVVQVWLKFGFVWYSIGSVWFNLGSIGSVSAQCWFTLVLLVQFRVSLIHAWFKFGSV